jgi:hypothetical protein
MKINVDLSEIFENEDGGIVKVSFTDRVIEEVSRQILESIERQTPSIISNLVESLIEKCVTDHMNKIIPELMNYEYTVTGQYGVEAKTWTVKNRILQGIEDTVVKKSPYSKTVLQDHIENTVNEGLKKFKVDFDKIVTKELTSKALEYAQTQLKLKLGI